MSGMGPASCWVTHKRLESWARAAKDRALGSTSPRHSDTGSNSTSSNNSLEEFNVGKEQHHGLKPIQNPSSETFYSKSDNPLYPNAASSSTLQHQSKSYPGGQPQLCRASSVCSQNSLDSSISRQGHRGSSPQIRTFAPDGKAEVIQHNEAAHSSSFPLRNTSRSPSPLRAASLDIRSSFPLGNEIKSPSPSQSNLTSIDGSSTSSSRSSRTGLARSLSPLLISTRILTPDVAGHVPPASPLGAIQPDLYVRQDGPLFIGGSPSNGPNLGRLHFRLKYDYDKSDLVVHLIEAHDLTSSDEGGFNDPFVRLLLFPEVDSRKRQTTIHRNDPNPLFDQHFKFPVSHEDLQMKTLVLQIFDYDRFSRNDNIGEVRMSMDEFAFTSNIEVWGEIVKNKKPADELQEILLSLSYLPSAERLTVVLLKARNLFMSTEKDSMDPFVKVYLIVNGKRAKKKKTAARKVSCNPVWNEALTFGLSSSNLNNAAIEVCVMDQGNDLIGNNPLIGCCIIGPRQCGAERDHWLDMTQSPRKTISCWHTIR